MPRKCRFEVVQLDDPINCVISLLFDVVIGLYAVISKEMSLMTWSGSS